MEDYKEIRKLADEYIDKKTADELGNSMIEGFRKYLTTEKAPETIPNGVAAKGIAYAAANVLARCAYRHGSYVSDDMKITFLAYFDSMFKQYIDKMNEKKEDLR